MRVALILAVAACGAFAQAPTPEQLFHEGVAAQQRGDDATAIRKYQELLKLRPDVMEVRANLGAVLAKEGRFDEAIAQYRAALAKNPANVPLRLNLALAYYKKGDFTEAVEQLQSLHGADPPNARVAMLLADCYAHLGKNEQVVAVLQPIETSHPDDLSVEWLLGSALIRSGNRREGLERVEKVARLGNSAEAWLLAGRAALDLTQFERARDDAAAAMRLSPNLPGVLSVRGMAMYFLGETEAATALLEKALAANPDDFDAHLAIGAGLRVARDLPGARGHLARAVELRPDSSLARYELARLERAEGNLDAAVRDFEKVVHADPNWAQPHIELSALYFQVNRAGDGERERTAFERLSAEPGK